MTGRSLGDLLCTLKMRYGRLVMSRDEHDGRTARSGVDEGSRTPDLQDHNLAL